jgi:hypothetical protein
MHFTVIKTFLHLVAEVFFAGLPLVVLGLEWPASGQTHPETFWSGPEQSMTSCILYGLTLSRLVQGAIVRGMMHPARDKQAAEEIAASYVFMALVPLIGVIISIIIIGKTASGGAITAWLWIQTINLLLSALVFFVIGGHGIRNAEE